MSKNVPIQKGFINPNPLTMKQMTQGQKLEDAGRNRAGVKKGQTLSIVTPKQK